MLDVRRLRLLHELALRGTVTAVAQALSYSPSSVSQQLSQLEKDVGVPLLQKAGRRVRLTPEAVILVGHTSELLDRLEQAESDLRASRTSVTGVVRIAVFQSAAHAIMPKALTILAAAHPELRVEIVEREPEAGLFEVSAREFDLAIAEQYPGRTRTHRPDLDRVELCRDEIRLAASRPLTLSGARTSAWVMEPAGTVSRLWAEQLCRAAGFEPDVRFETADLMAHIRLVRSGNAVGLLPDLVWAGDEPSVALSPLPDRPHRTVFSSARHAAAARPALVACRRALEQALTPA